MQIKVKLLFDRFAFNPIFETHNPHDKKYYA